MTVPPAQDTRHVDVPTSILYDTTLSAGAKVVWAMLASYQDLVQHEAALFDGAVVGFEMSASQLATLAGKSLATTERFLKELREAGLLEVIAGGQGGGRANIWRVHTTPLMAEG